MYPHISLRKGLRWAAFVIVLLVMAAWGLLATGRPQRALLEFVAGRGLGAEVAAGTVSVLDRLQVSDLRVFDDAAARQRDAFTARVTGLDLDYTLLPENSRYFPSLTIDSLTVRLDGAEPEERNFDFLLELLERPGMIDPVPVIPCVAEIRDIAFDVTFPSMGVMVKGLQLTAELDDLERLSIGLEGQPVSARWWLTAPENVQHALNGVVDLRVRRAGGTIIADPVRVTVPGLAEVEGKAKVVMTEPIECDVDLRTFLLQPVDLTHAGWAALPVPVRFGKLDMSGTRLKGGLTEGVPAMAGSELHLAVEALVVGEKYRELYEGNVAIHALAEDAHVDLGVVLNRGQKLTGTVQGDPDSGCAKVALEGWSREDILTAVPKDFRPNVALFSPLEHLSATIEFEWADSTWNAEATADPVFAVPGGAPETLGLTLQARAMTATGAMPLAEGELTARLRDQTAAISASTKSPGQIRATVRLDEVNPDAWMTILTEEHGLAALDTRLTGTVDVQPGPEPDTFDLALDLAASPLLYDGLGIPERETLGITGRVAVDSTSHGRATGDVLDLSVGEGIELEVKDWWITFDTFAAQADITAEADLHRLAALLHLGDLWGEAQARVSCRNEQGVHTVDFEVRAEPVGYGDLAVLYGTPITASGTAHYDSLGWRGGGSHWAIRVGEGTALTSDALVFEPEPFQLDAPFALQTDLVPLVHMGYLDAATGSGTVSGRLRVEEGRVHAEAELCLEATSLVLNSALAALTSVSATGVLVYAETLTGSAEVAVDEIVVAGATLRDVQGRLLVEGDTLRAEEFEGVLFDGTLRAEAEVGIFLEGLPVRFSAQVEGLDLETLIGEMAPGSAKLTGLASGDATLAFDADGFEELRLELRATEDLSLDRDTVLGLLEDVEPDGRVGSGERLGRAAKRRAVEKVVGKAPRRSFDRAELTLECAGPRLAGHGQAIIESEQLNLTIELPIHPDTLLKMLELRQLEKIENIRAKGVNFGE